MTGQGLNAEEETTILDIVDLAAKLAVDCARQRCRLRTVSYQHQQPARIGDITDRNRGNLRTTVSEVQNEENIVELFIAPGLQREGDSRGGSWNTSPTVLNKADVFMKRIHSN
jgi:hypothetical protein